MHLFPEVLSEQPRVILLLWRLARQMPWKKDAKFYKQCRLQVGTPRTSTSSVSILLPHSLNPLMKLAAGGVGFGSKVKVVNQLLAGVHLAAAGEAFALAKKKDMNLKQVLDVVGVAAASSYVMHDRKRLQPSVAK